MLAVAKEFRFEAAHILPRHPGKCSNLHGHSWRVRVIVHGPLQKESGFVMDFYELGKLVDPICDMFDHQMLNWFVRYPSSENIAIHIAHLLRPALYGKFHYTVSVSETVKTWASWTSKSNYCRSIFDHDLLDTWPEAVMQEYEGSGVSKHDVPIWEFAAQRGYAVSNMDAEWRSPDMGWAAKQLFGGGVPNKATAEELLKEALSELLVYGMFVKQSELYLASQGQPGAVMREVKGAIDSGIAE